MSNVTCLTPEDEPFQREKEKLFEDSEKLQEIKRDTRVIDFIMLWECGEPTENEIIEGFQILIDSGQAWTLQGMYGRMAKTLIDMEVCHYKK